MNPKVTHKIFMIDELGGIPRRFGKDSHSMSRALSYTGDPVYCNILRSDQSIVRFYGLSRSQVADPCSQLTQKIEAGMIQDHLVNKHP